MILMIDNHDSFAYNLVQYFRLLGQSVDVIGVDDLDPHQIAIDKYSHLCLSPGPGHPQERKNCLALIEACTEKLPILGVCLGHQMLAYSFGAKVTHAERIMHGKTSFIAHNNQGLFNQLPDKIKVARYHSLVVDEESLSATPFERCAWIDDENEQAVIMAMQHKSLPIFGIQFHPESIATEYGLNMIEHFINTSSR